MAALRHGVAIEDALACFEPPVCRHPVCLSLGAVPLAAGDAKAAEVDQGFAKAWQRADPRPEHSRL